MNPKQIEALRNAAKTLAALQTFWSEGPNAAIWPSALLLDSDATIHEAVAASVTAIEENFPEIME